ncbi:MAG: metallophosphoesterase [Deltaproteobacteria bacterium]|nr:metallophosphoesterase [Deltaproteobacteria bacterium]
MKLLAIAFPLVVLGISAACIWYVAFQIRTLFGLTRRWLLRIGIAAGFFASVVVMLSAAGSTSSVFGVLNVLGGYVFIFFVFLTLILIVLHAIQLLRVLPGKWIGSLALILALVITAVGALNANRFSVSETEIAIPGLQKDAVVMHISDIHIGPHRGRDYLAKIVEETNQRRPDLVLINGDLLDSKLAVMNDLLSPLEAFDAPVYFVGGNHEKYVGTGRAFEEISKHDVRILHNEVAETNGIYLIGLDYMNADEDTFDMHPSNDKRTIKSVLPALALADDRPSVLMHHSPVGAQYVAERGIDLMLPGHTHAGQVFPGTLFASLVFRFNRGLHHEGKTKVFVSQGAGTFMSRVRLGTSNEINLIRLKVKQ